jgi:MFS family permease
MTRELDATRPVLGWVREAAATALDRRTPEAAVGIAVFALQAIALLVILLTSGMAALLLAVALLGAGRGGVTLMRATLVADRYGRANFAAISGIPAAAQTAARALAPVGAGLLVTWLGGYAPMLAVLLAIALAATLAMGLFALSARPLRLRFDVAERRARRNSA